MDRSASHALTGRLAAGLTATLCVLLALPEAGLGSTRFASPAGADAGACAAATSACRTLGFAFRQAAPGDVVELASGAYGDQTVAPVAGRAGPAVEFRPAAGAAVSFASLDIRGSYVTVRDFTADSLTVDDYGNPVRGVRVVNGRAKTVWIQNAHDTRFLGGSYGGNFNDATVKIGGPSASTGLVFDGVDFHDALATNAEVHMECMWAAGVQDFTVRNSIFRNCTYFDIFFTRFQGPDPKNVLLENNVFEQTYLWDRRDGYYSVMAASHLTKVENFTFRNNDFASPIIFEPASVSGVRVAGNVGEGVSWLCKPGVAYSHNVWTAARCSGTDKQAGGLFGQFAAPAAHDWRLKAGAAAINAGDPADAPPTDREGLARNGPPDAGAHEFGGRRPSGSPPPDGGAVPNPGGVDGPAGRAAPRLVARLARRVVCRRPRRRCPAVAKVRLRVPERAKLTVLLERRRARGWKKVRSVRRRARAGALTVPVAARGLPRGRYRVRVVAVESGGRRVTRVLPLRVRR